MRISDWSSDVCSSDLPHLAGLEHFPQDAGGHRRQTGLVDAVQAGKRVAPAIRCHVHGIKRHQQIEIGEPGDEAQRVSAAVLEMVDQLCPRLPVLSQLAVAVNERRARVGLEGRFLDADRSEEHTSELQSLMRNSYAVFCLKKKIKRRRAKTQ